MGSNRHNGHSELGIGIGLRTPHINHILNETPPVAWFEIISENFMGDGGQPAETLARIMDHYTVVQHGVGLSIGSPQGLEPEHLRRLKALLRRTGSPWFSDHLCWGSVDGRVSHELLPLPYTDGALAVCVENAKRVQGETEVPFIVENVSSYMEFKASTMPEWEFLGRVADRADVGILLDVNNIYVSSVNHGFDPLEYLENIPHERVAQIHIAGHTRIGALIIDTHDHPVIDPVWDLYDRAIELCGATPTLLEWDAQIPCFEVVHAEALKATERPGWKERADGR